MGARPRHQHRGQGPRRERAAPGAGGGRGAPAPGVPLLPPRCLCSPAGERARAAEAADPRRAAGRDEAAPGLGPSGGTADRDRRGEGGERGQGSSSKEPVGSPRGRGRGRLTDTASGRGGGDTAYASEGAGGDDTPGASTYSRSQGCRIHPHGLRDRKGRGWRGRAELLARTTGEAFGESC